MTLRVALIDVFVSGTRRFIVIKTPPIADLKWFELAGFVMLDHLRPIGWGQATLAQLIVNPGERLCHWIAFEAESYLGVHITIGSIFLVSRIDPPSDSAISFVVLLGQIDTLNMSFNAVTIGKVGNDLGGYTLHLINQ